MLSIGNNYRTPNSSDEGSQPFERRTLSGFVEVHNVRIGKAEDGCIAKTTVDRALQY